MIEVKPKVNRGNVEMFDCANDLSGDFRLLINFVSEFHNVVKVNIS